MVSFLAGITLLTALLSVALPATSWAASSHDAAPAAFCVKVQASVAPHHAHPGDDMSIFGSWENCGRSVFIRVRFTLEAPCGQSFRDAFHMRLHAHEGVAEGTGFKACRGTYRATVWVLGNGQLLDRMSRRVHVRP
jgi:hypothetical protein